MSQECRFETIRLEVADMLERDGYRRECAIDAVDRVGHAFCHVSELYLNALAWLQDDWQRLSYLYMSTAIAYLKIHYIIDEFRFSQHPQHLGYIMTVSKRDPLKGCVMWGVKRTKEGFMGSYGITPLSILEIL